MGGWGWVTTKWWAKVISRQKTAIGAIFTSKYHTKQLNAWPNSSASCVVNYSWLSACQGEMEQFEEHPSTRGCVTSLGNMPQQKNPRQLSVPIPD